jgi:hypothetical protein
VPATAIDIPDLVETARLAVAGGATMVQLRDKHAGTARMVETGRALRQVLAGTGARLIVNDDVEAAIAIGADGLHPTANRPDCRANPGSNPSSHSPLCRESAWPLWQWCRRQIEIDCVAELVDGSIQICPSATHLHISFIDPAAR